MEVSASGDADSSKRDLLVILSFLRKRNLKDTEDTLRKEAGLLHDVANADDDVVLTTSLREIGDSSESQKYDQHFCNLQEFVAKSLDMYRSELALILYPIFVYMFLDLIKQGREMAAGEFFAKHRHSFESYHQEDLDKLSTLHRREQLPSHQLAVSLRSEKYVVCMARDSFQCLVRHLQEHQQNLVLNLINQYLLMDLNNGLPRGRHDIALAAGALGGEAPSAANKAQVFYGMPRDPDMVAAMNEQDDEDGEDGKAKKKKPKRDAGALGKKGKQAVAPNAPPPGRLPLPTLKDREREMKRSAARELSKATPLGDDNMPSVCFFTMLNTHGSLNCTTMSSDSTLLAAGMADSSLRLHSINHRRLKALKAPSDLAQLEPTDPNILDRIVDDHSGGETRILHGHAGPVYASSFNMYNSMILSSSQDGTVRLWDLNTYTPAVCFKGHIYPVWDVTFCPMSYYFASASHDRTARMWATDQPHPVRIFAEHLSDVSCVRFHPNGHYLATGSHDRTVRLWDVGGGGCVRFLTGHHGAVMSLAFSPDGRFLASGATDGSLRLWDMAGGSLVTTLPGHTETVLSLAFSHDGSILASGGLDCAVRLWDVRAVLDAAREPEFQFSSNSSFDSNSCLLSCLPTKSTAVQSVHFTRRNLLMCAGPYVH